MCAVEWKKLGEVATYYRGVTYNKTQEVALNSGGTKILRANNIPIERNSLNFEDIKEISQDVKVKDYQWLKADDILICAGSGSKEHVGKVAYINHDMDYAYGGFMGKIVSNDILVPRYLFHVISSRLFKKYLNETLYSTTINNLNSDIVNKFLIPVPTLAKQQEIVSHLDTFTTLISNLESELEMHRKQYEHYRNQLLDFEGVEMKLLQEVAAINRGVRVVKSDLDEFGEIPVYQNSLTPLGYKENNNRNKNTTFVICAGAAGDIGFSDIDFWAADDCSTINCGERLIDKYIYHFLKTKQSFLKSRVRKAGVPRLANSVIGNLDVALPPIQVQQQIVEKLDAFEHLIQSLESEIKLRKQQYEYYREKLLTFEKEIKA